MGGIFISYRRQDSSGHTGRLRDNLRARFGKRVFQDVDGIADGEVFETVLAKALAACDVALVVIGRDWVSSADSLGQRRLDDPHDWVRTETRQLLERNIRVIPVLVGGAAMPQAKDLPEDMRALVKRQARELRDTAWDADVEALMQRLDEVFGVGASRQASAATGSSKRWIGLGAAAVVVAGVGAWFTRSDPVVDAGDGGLQPVEDGGEAGIVAAARAIDLLGTWRIDDFSGLEPEEGAATTYEMRVVGDGVQLVPVDGNDASDVRIVKQITDRAVTLASPDVDGKPFDYMYVFNLSADSNELHRCSTVRVADFDNLGPCQWSYRRVTPGASARTRPDVSCVVESAADVGCVDTAEALGLISNWKGPGDDGYRFVLTGEAVRLVTAGADTSAFAVQSIKGDTLTLGWTPFADPSDFDPQQTYEYELTDDGSRLVNCVTVVLYSTRSERTQCEDVPHYLVREGD